MSAPIQGRPEAKGGGEAEKRGEEEEGGRGPAELQFLLRSVRLRPGNDRRSSHCDLKDLLVKQQRIDSNEKIRKRRVERVQDEVDRARGCASVCASLEV